MMNDEQLDALLRRVQPAGPSDRLRARILDGARPVGRAWTWWLAAAAALGVVVGGHAMADRVQGRIAAAVAPAAPDGGDLAALRDAVNGNEQLLRSAAEWNAEEERQQQEPQRR
jgi:hypothetical protein